MSQVWSLYNHAKTWGVRPSELLDLHDPYVAYCLDEAVATFGNGVVQELDSVEGKTSRDISRKRKAILGKLLQLPDEMRFRAPPKRPDKGK